MGVLERSHQLQFGRVFENFIFKWPMRPQPPGPEPLLSCLTRVLTWLAGQAQQGGVGGHVSPLHVCPGAISYGRIRARSPL